MNEDEMIELLNRRASMKPAPGMAGVFYRDSPACAALSSGCGQFLWFESMPGLLEFLRDHAHDMNLGMGPMHLDHQALRAQATTITESAIQGDLSLRELIPQLNTTLEGFTEIEWVGLFEDLVLGLDSFAIGVKRAFKKERGLPAEGECLLSNDEIAPFKDFMSGYGV